MVNEIGYIVLNDGKKIITTVLKKTDDKICTTSGNFYYCDIASFKTRKRKEKNSLNLIKIKNNLLRKKDQRDVIVKKEFYEKFKEIGKWGHDYVDELERMTKAKENE